MTTSFHPHHHVIDPPQGSSACAQIVGSNKKPGRSGRASDTQNGGRQWAAAGVNFETIPSSGLKVCWARSV